MKLSAQKQAQPSKPDMTIDRFYAEVAPFIDKFNNWAGELRFGAKADHICYKCGASEEFVAIRSLFELPGTYHFLSFISGRRIVIIKLPKPIPTLLGKIWFLELSDQKPDGSQTSGFDHIEVYPTHVTLEQMVASLAERGISFEQSIRPHHQTYDLTLKGGFGIRLEPEPLIETIKRRDMK